MSRDFTIETLGAKGDGVAHENGAPIFVPFALPGERVAAEQTGNRAVPSTILARSPERQQAPCPHFGACGGCDLQHASQALYRRFKRGLVVDAFAARGLDPEVGDLVPCAPATRRRAVFSGTRQGGDFAFGFHAAMSDRIVAIAVCLVVVPAIAARLADLRTLASLLSPRKGEVRITVTATAAGLDVAVAGSDKIDERLRREVVGFALARDFARLAVGNDVLVETRPPSVAVGRIAVTPPPGGFLQAVASAEDAMAALVSGHLAGGRKVADLFAGVGAFALRLAEHGPVHAVESEAAALQALDRARRDAAGLKPVTLERRDLFRRPLVARELAAFSGVAFDPPRAGAEAQTRELALSKVEQIAAVSCNPATLARDCRILVDGGYRLLRVTPVDQFLWSHHVEAVALLER